MKIPPDETQPIFRLEGDIFENRTYYFITTFDPRFDLAASFLSKILFEVKNCRWEPIFIRPYPVAEYPKQKNIIYFCPQVKTPFNSFEIFHRITIPVAEDFNLCLSEALRENERLRNFISALGEKQGKIPIFSFTTSFLDITNPEISVMGPSSKLATELDSKINQQEIFRHQSVPFPESLDICRNFEELANNFPRYPKPCVASAEYGSGGAGTAVLRATEDLENFRKTLTIRYETQKYIVTPFIEATFSPNSTGFIVDNDTVLVISVSDQILYKARHEIKYLGNCYPSAVPKKTQDEIVSYTKHIGESLASKGYRGFFGCDFVVTKEGKCFVVDLNPRKQGGFLCNLLMFETLRPKNCPGLLELELMQVDQPNPPLSSSELSKLKKLENPHTPFAWAQRKIRPRHKPIRISDEIREGSEELCFCNIGSHCVKSFFPKGEIFQDGSFLGCVITTGNSRDEALNKLTQLELSAYKKLEKHDKKNKTKR